MFVEGDNGEFIDLHHWVNLTDVVVFKYTTDTGSTNELHAYITGWAWHHFSICWDEVEVSISYRISAGSAMTHPGITTLQMPASFTAN